MQTPTFGVVTWHVFMSPGYQIENFIYQQFSFSLSILLWDYLDYWFYYMLFKFAVFQVPFFIFSIYICSKYSPPISPPYSHHSWVFRIANCVLPQASSLTLVSTSFYIELKGNHSHSRYLVKFRIEKKLHAWNVLRVFSLLILGISIFI